VTPASHPPCLAGCCFSVLNDVAGRNLKTVLFFFAYFPNSQNSREKERLSYHAAIIQQRGPWTPAKSLTSQEEVTSFSGHFSSWKMIATKWASKEILFVPYVTAEDKGTIRLGQVVGIGWGEGSRWRVT
jgi:hypothetical protein